MSSTQGPSHGVEAQVVPDYHPGTEEETRAMLSDGNWKTGVFGCLNQCIPTCCGAWCCGPCLTARLYDQFVRRGRYGLVLGSFILLYILQVSFQIIMESNLPTRTVTDHEDGSTTVETKGGNEGRYDLFYVLSNIVSMALIYLVVYCLYHARQAIRARYNIRGGDFQDCCCSLWCSLCVLSQMYRQVHTVEGCCGPMDCRGLGPVPDEEVMLMHV